MPCAQAGRYVDARGALAPAATDGDGADPGLGLPPARRGPGRWNRRLRPLVPGPRGTGTAAPGCEDDGARGQQAGQEKAGTRVEGPHRLEVKRRPAAVSLTKR
jgi:hypothetical protein